MEWLLIGGPGHGKKLPIKAGLSIWYVDKDGKDHSYPLQLAVVDGRSYALGVGYADDEPPLTFGEIRRLILNAELTPLPG